MSTGMDLQTYPNPEPSKRERFKSWFGILNNTRRLVNGMDILHDPVMIETGLKAVTQLMQHINFEGSDAATRRRLVNSLIRDLNEVATRCERLPHVFTRWNRSPWRAPDPLELTIYWYQLAQITAFVEGRYTQYGDALQKTDPHLRVVSQTPTSESDGYGQPAPNTISSLKPKDARRLYRRLQMVFRRTARAARASARQIPLRPEQTVTVLHVSTALATLFAISAWLAEQEIDIKHKFEIGGPLHAPPPSSLAAQPGPATAAPSASEGGTAAPSTIPTSVQAQTQNAAHGSAQSQAPGPVQEPVPTPAPTSQGPMQPPGAPPSGAAMI